MDAFSLAGPAMRLLDPETAHRLTLAALSRGLAPRRSAPDDPVLATTVWGLRFPNPLGLAAGFDKNAEAMGAMLGFGLGFVEVGTVTPRPQPGNPRPRIFRLSEDLAVINRLGFNNAGATAAARRLMAWRERSSAAAPAGVVGVNVGKNKETADAAADYARAAGALGPLADYLVINVSSPNTPGLRALQGRAELEAIVARVRGALAEGGGPGQGRSRPLLVKIAPDLEPADLEDIAAVALDGAVDGLIATNTTIARPGSLRGARAGETGGLSGQPLFEPSTRVLAALYRLTGGKVPLVGVGGVASGEQAYGKIRAGASLVQLYTALTYRGPSLIGEIKRDLAALLRRDGFSSPAEAVGTASSSR